MVKKIKQKAAPFIARSREEETKRLATVQESDANWTRQEAARKILAKKESEPPMEALEAQFVSYSPMSDIDEAPEKSDDGSVDAILPFDETMSESARNSEDGTIAGISVGDVGKLAGSNIESNRSVSRSNEQSTEASNEVSNTSRTIGTSAPPAGRRESKVRATTFSQEDFELLANFNDLLNTQQIAQLTGGQLEQLYEVFYRKHPERKRQYMLPSEVTIHAFFELMNMGAEVAQPSVDRTTRNSTRGGDDSRLSLGFTPIQHTHQGELSERPALESFRCATEESSANIKSRYTPTTKEVLTLYDGLRQNSNIPMEESHLGRNRASPRPETFSPALGKRNRADSPNRGHIITSVAASDFTLMEGEITPEMATNFERQVGRLPGGIKVIDCVAGSALVSLETRLKTDRDQNFVAREDMKSWKEHITLQTLSKMLMKYYGP